jgi:hypothetical protein
VRPLPRRLRWLFWDVDPGSIDLARHRDFVIPRVLEHGGIAEVRWLLDRVGLDDVHRFLREVGHPELSARTLAFWRAVFRAWEEEWAGSPPWRDRSSAPWID